MSQMLSSDLTEPLTDKDRQFIERMLSDPSVFPKEFKRWITEHSSDTVDIAKTQVHGLTNSSGQVVIGGASVEMLGGVLCGFVMGWPGSAPPAGWLLCDGHEELRADFANLFALIGVGAGTPSDGTKFRLPDYRDRSLYGAGSIVGLLASDGIAAGSRGGPNHFHTVAAHQHYFSDTKYHEFGGGGRTGGVGDHTHQHIGATSAVYPQGQQAGITYSTPGFGNTLGGGAHDHAFSVTVGGNVHLEGLSQNGGSGPTTGGGNQDRPSWAGVNFIMGSGNVPA